MATIDSIVIREVNRIDGSMGAIYQAMCALLRQSCETKKDMKQETKAAHDQQYAAARASVDAKKREIEEQRRAAQDEWRTTIAAAMASCSALAAEVTKTGHSVKSLYGAPDKQRAQRFTANADMLNRRLVILNDQVNRLCEILNSGKIGSVPSDDLKKLETQFSTSLQLLRSTKTFAVENVKKRGRHRGER